MSLSPTRVAAASLEAVPRKSLSRLLGGLARVQAPERVLNPMVELYCRAYGVDLDECEVPAGGFESFDAFFTRRLRDGVRPLPADPADVASVADGCLEDGGPVDPSGSLTIKGKPYSVEELLGDPREVEHFAAGQYYIVYLSPRDYHRVHAPVSGQVVCSHHVPGTLYPVNAIGERHVTGLFARNERVAVYQESPIHGRVCTVLVGAIGVGRISLSFDDRVLTNADRHPTRYEYPRDQTPQLSRGDELGMFHLGSTAIVFMRPEGHWNLCAPVGHRVKMGEALVRRVG